MRYTIELIINQEKINIYSIKIESEEDNEFQNFLNKFPLDSPYRHDRDVIVSWILRIAEHGALERYFRNEGNYNDGVCAIPIEVGQLRLYCLRLSDGCLIVGNGDIKNTRTWQENPILAPLAKLLIHTAKTIKIRRRKRSITFNGKDISGNLNFEYNEEE